MGKSPRPTFKALKHKYLSDPHSCLTLQVSDSGFLTCLITLMLLRKMLIYTYILPVINTFSFGTLSFLLSARYNIPIIV